MPVSFLRMRVAGRRAVLRGAVWLSGALLVAACGGGGGSPAPGGGGDPAPKPQALRTTDAAGLVAWFREALGPGAAGYLGSAWALDTVRAVAAISTAASPAASFSGTTLQEAGVDEADLLKTDGVFVYNLEGGSTATTPSSLLRRQRLSASAPTLLPVDTLGAVLSADVRAQGLYLDVDRRQAAVLGQGGSSPGVYDAWFAPQAWRQGVVEVALVDTPDAAAMHKRRHLRISANLIGSRRVGATLYLVLRSYPDVPGLDPYWSPANTAANQAVLAGLQAGPLLPSLSVDGAAPQPLVQPQDCLLQDANAVRSADIITLVAVDLASAVHRHAARCFVGGSEAFYMSEQSLYLATSRSGYSYTGALPVYPPAASTDLHKFALSGLDIGYRGSGNVAGHLGFDQNRKSFRMGEHVGALRVLTQTDAVWGGWLAMPVSSATASAAPASPARLSILQEAAGALALVGELPNAARPDPLGKPGEQIYATRFLGARGYLVTYRLTDPLYVLDLANPRDPRVSGELQVTGYSDYLFPLSDTLLLGVGKEAAVDGSAGDGRFAWYQGVKVSLIDVSDPTRPREAARQLIGRRGTDATVLHDHHGIAILPTAGGARISLPVSLHDTPTAGMTGAANDYYAFTRTELARLDVNTATTSLTLRPSLVESGSPYRDIGNDRSLLWGEQVHWFSGGANWQSAGW